MRRAVGLLLVLITLSCGNKGSLYLPTPEQDPQQSKSSKPAPRQ